MNGNGNIKAVLFDIDGTILDCSRTAGIALIGATRETFGTEGRMRMINIQGKTDPLILRESLEGMGLGDAEIKEKTPLLKKLYFDRLAELIKTAECRLMPGINDLIPLLAGRKDVILGLLTGNFRESARIKLDRFGLFPSFAFGVYGDDGEMRNQLPPVARIRLGEIFGLDIPFDRMIIIGDTVHDIRCAKYSGAVSVAVATGWTQPSDLLAEEPDYFFETLEDPDGFLELVDSI